MGGSGINVLVAPWGDPSGWRGVSYRYEGREAIKSITSLIPILCNEEIGRVIILVQDSVIFTQPKTMNNIARECGSSLIRECGDDKSEAVWKDITEVRGYNDIVDTARKYIQCIVGKAIESAESTCGVRLKELSGNVDIVVVPSKGTFNIKCGGLDQTVNFKGDVFDQVYSVALLGLHKALTSLNDVGRVIFDATHGVNYFTIMSMMATQDVLSILAFHNAWSGKAMPRLTIYNAIPEALDDYLITKVGTYLPSIRRLERQDVGNLQDTTKVFYNALVYNVPLALYYLKKEEVGVDKYDDFVSRVMVEQQGNTLNVNYNLKERAEGIHNETYLRLLLSEVTSNIKEPNDEELTKLANSLYSMISEASRTIIIHEVNNIRNRAQSRLGGVCSGSICTKRLSEVLGPVETAEVGRAGGGEIELRHLTAHAGLLRDYTTVTIIVENAKIKKIIFRYEDQDWKCIKGLLSDQRSAGRGKAHLGRHRDHRGRFPSKGTPQ